VLPREHGSWSLALEPLALGLVAAPSVAGGALALAAFLLFLARRPAQAVRTGDPRLALAAGVTFALGFAAVSAVWFAHSQASGAQVTWALLVVLPPAAAFAWFDRQKAGRELAAELSGAGVFAGFALAIAISAGRSWTDAAWIAGFACVRGATTILSVRTFLRRRKGEAVSRLPAAVAAIAGCAGFALLGVRSGAWAPLAWALVFAARVAWLLGPRAPSWTARKLGTIEAILGAVVVVSAGIALR
jgi:hypothetical protein